MILRRYLRTGPPAIFLLSVWAAFGGFQGKSPPQFEIVRYNNPDLIVDLGVGLWAWPLPTDYDGDGDYDLLVSCPDKPYNGTYFFENRGGDARYPVFAAGVRIGPGYQNIQISYVAGREYILVPGKELSGVPRQGMDGWKSLPLPENIHSEGRKIRANQWKYCDYDGDGALDLVVGVGDWQDYGWDDAFDADGNWTNGPLRGWVYLVRNAATSGEPRYEDPILLRGKNGAALEVYGRPSPNFADFDRDGDLDLLCGEFLDRFTYFENVGSRTDPEYAAGRILEWNGEPIRMDLEMIAPVAVDWDRDGDLDLVVGDEDGRVALVENTGRIRDSVPEFRPPQYFRQEADAVKFGALVTPYNVDWDGDGDEDLICGNTAGYVGFFENLEPGRTPRWAAVRYLEADGKVIRIQAGTGGSIQGPAEAKWGYTTLNVADWDADGLPDLVLNSIWGEVLWYRNVGTRRQPELTAAQPVEVDWEGTPPKPEWTWWAPKGRQLVTQWRTTPVVVDWNSDGLNDLVMLDHEGYLALFERVRKDGRLALSPGRRVFLGEDGQPLRLNPGRAGKSGRRKLQAVDWDGDGRLDLLVNSENADLLRNLGGSGGQTKFSSPVPVSGQKLAGHTTSPTVVDWNSDGVPDLLLGTESGFLYYLENPRSK